jgi:isopentenyldiphosphate isomerase
MNKYYRWIEECNKYKLNEFIPFVIKGNDHMLADIIVGYIHHTKLQWLNQFSDIEFKDNKLSFIKSITNLQQRTKAINSVAKILYQQQKIKSWVGEQYDVCDYFGSEVLFTIERAAATLFGIQKQGVHVNAYVIKNAQYYIWVAKRAIDKPTWPGKLDHLVAGGHTSGLAIETTLQKECQEEAGMNLEQSSQAIAVGIVDYNVQTNNNLSRDTIFIYDIELDDNFIPKNTDGEVDEFFLWPIEQVLETIRNTQDYKTNCNLVIIDFAIRHGFIKPDDDRYVQIVNGLRHNVLI